MIKYDYKVFTGDAAYIGESIESYGKKGYKLLSLQLAVAGNGSTMSHTKMIAVMERLGNSYLSKPDGEITE